MSNDGEAQGVHPEQVFVVYRTRKNEGPDVEDEEITIGAFACHAKAIECIDYAEEYFESGLPSYSIRRVTLDLKEGGVGEQECFAESRGEHKKEYQEEIARQHEKRGHIWTFYAP